jgi:hypothetical protein
VKTADEIAALSDELLIEELLIALTLYLDTGPLTREVIRRGLVERAAARASQQTARERRRLGD